ncbi:hybrid sensor histidine kinase/response regulator [Hyella patelloides]|uniref:hybrid sensor histidine kinase/response regulator n=1 Tax=Hyella patelloides TaxID=1982969 RepID=UPI001FE2D49D|nr:hybrid sensor histidine kinase/response regulator [Hyella patelloides]
MIDSPEEPKSQTNFAPLEHNFIFLELNGLQSTFEIDAAVTDSPEAIESDFDPLEQDFAELNGLQSTFEIDAAVTDSPEAIEADFDPLEQDFAELNQLQSAFEIDADVIDSQEEPKIETDFDLLEQDFAELNQLQSAFEIDADVIDSQEEPKIETDFDLLEQDFAELNQLQSAFEIDADVIEKKQQTTTNSSTNFLSPQKKNFVDKMVRVPVSQLKQFNSLFEQLILDRNTIGLRLKQLQNVMSLMNQRMIQIERSNTQLKQWYDRASIEGLLSTDQQQAVQNSVNSLTSNHDLLKDKLKSDLGKAQTYSDRFDTLEMDRYSDVHLICQEQIETIVQLQEVSTDIELGLQEISQAVRNLDYTTKSMQGNVTRTQMLPFAEVVKRFPRVIRDLNIQFNKQVDLKIIGENSLLDRSIIEALSDPLMHLLRNAFDHGIEDTETRIAAGKPPSGTITIQANSRGTYTIITVSDDGGGISLDKIRDRVCQMGIPQSEVTQIPEADLLDFIFDPGFSTAKQATELSGRGVGMDVVRTNLEEIRGNVRVETKPGEGTTFTLRIPFTLSILRVAIIEQAGIILAIPANSIREIVPLELEKVKISEDNKYIPWNQTEIPLVEIEKTLVYHRVHNSFGLTENPAIDRPMAILIKDGKTFAALRISRFWHEQESTMRLIDSPIPLPSGIISSMVFGDGKVIPLIDPIILIEECLSNKSTRDRSYQNHHLNRNLFTTETILVVDDSINVRRYLCLTLEKAGYRVEQAKDGQEAVDKLLGGLSAQAVICDIEMPRLDGYGVLEEIKERAEFTQLPIIMLTSRSNEKHQKLAMNLGASAYLTKPYNEQQLLNRLAKLLDD